jgi:hypothetical protein
MTLSPKETADFHDHGYALIANPIDVATMNELDCVQREIQPVWEKMDFPPDVNSLACQMLLGGEIVYQMVEHPGLVGMAKTILDVDQVVVSAFGMGDTASTVGGARRQVPWHSDSFDDAAQVAVRVVLDPHEGANAPLRVLPGSHKRSHDEVHDELMEIETAASSGDDVPDLLYVYHPDEVELALDPQAMLVWTPKTWHATGVKTSTDLRRAITWHYFAPGLPNPFQNAVLHTLDGIWQGWSKDRKALWGLPVSDSPS